MASTKKMGAALRFVLLAGASPLALTPTPLARVSCLGGYTETSSHRRRRLDAAHIFLPLRTCFFSFFLFLSGCSPSFTHTAFWNTTTKGEGGVGGGNFFLSLLAKLGGRGLCAHDDERYARGRAGEHAGACGCAPRANRRGGGGRCDDVAACFYPLADHHRILSFFFFFFFFF